MKKWRLIGGITLMFVLGLLVGSAGTRYYHDYRQEHLWRNPQARIDFFMKRLTRELDLSPDQQKELRSIAEEYDRRREAIDVQRRADIRKILDEGFSRMKQRLSPEQQKKLDELRVRHEERRRKRVARGPS